MNENLYNIDLIRDNSRRGNDDDDGDCTTARRAQKIREKSPGKRRADETNEKKQ